MLCYDVLLWCAAMVCYGVMWQRACLLAGWLTSGRPVTAHRSFYTDDAQRNECMRCDMHTWMNDIEQNGNPQHTSTTAQSDTTRCRRPRPGRRRAWWQLRASRQPSSLLPPTSAGLAGRSRTFCGLVVNRCRGKRGTGGEINLTVPCLTGFAAQLVEAGPPLPRQRHRG
jgi:hypothetical protein